jgi:hypothetical protein
MESKTHIWPAGFGSRERHAERDGGKRRKEKRKGKREGGTGEVLTEGRKESERVQNPVKCPR